MAEPQAILAAIEKMLGADATGPRAGATPLRSLAGRRVLITSGPTQEPIDPVRYIANRSSGKQGHALARAAVALGAEVTLVTGPVALPDPQGAHVVRVETAEQMLAAVLAALPADIAICAAAVADWRAADAAPQKLKKQGRETSLRLTQNPDILATIAKPGPKRPRLVIGFAAETDKLIANASEKRSAKGADWIVANDVSPGTGVMGADLTQVHLITASGVEDWPSLSKDETASRLLARAAAMLAAMRPAAE
jgi:phosphopantothenoylcysteine decarboxylase/phosphopantothenate--cysteine ligase